MAVGVTPSGQPIEPDLPTGWWRDSQGRIRDSAGRVIDPKTMRPVGEVAGQQPAGTTRAEPVPKETPQNTPAAALVPSADPLGDYDPWSPGIQNAGRGRHGMPGQEKWAADDKYGPGMRQNTNQAGVQSNGDDDPWLIGAFEGGTYDPQVMAEWIQRAAKGDANADWLLRTVGMAPGMSEQDWAASRGLTRRAEAFAPGGKWYSDQSKATPPKPATPTPTATTPAVQQPAAPVAGPSQGGRRGGSSSGSGLDPAQPGNTVKPPLFPEDEVAPGVQNQARMEYAGSEPKLSSGASASAGLAKLSTYGDDRASSPNMVGGEIGTRRWSGAPPSAGAAAKRSFSWSLDEPLPWEGGERAGSANVVKRVRP